MIDFNNFYITYSNQNLEEFTLKFQLRNTSVTDRWINKVLIAKKKFDIDDPSRFGGFGSINEQSVHSIQLINETIKIINDHKPLIDKQLNSVDDQDTLNYLHHIFEVYHGLLNQQTHEYWLTAPDNVRKALTNLNILVHQCEAISRDFNKPHHYVTWYRLPKIDQLKDEEYDLFEDTVKEGTVYLLYTEIGKTLEDLAVDNDQYIFDNAFKPFRHYSADFVVKFWDSSPDIIESNRKKVKQYYDNHSDFFINKDLPWGHPYLSTGAIPLADLIEAPENYLEILATHRCVKDVYFI